MIDEVLIRVLAEDDLMKQQPTEGVELQILLRTVERDVMADASGLLAYTRCYWMVGERVMNVLFPTGSFCGTVRVKLVTGVVWPLSLATGA